MPIYEFLCQECGATSEWVLASSGAQPTCKACGSARLKKLLSATSPLSGAVKQGLPGPGDTACCGHSPAHAGCAGPGSCCGKGG